jgi:hypothetical protein
LQIRYAAATRLPWDGRPQAQSTLLVGLQAPIIAFSQDFQLVMIVIASAIPLAIMIGSTKAALRKQSQAPDHAAVIDWVLCAPPQR